MGDLCLCVRDLDQLTLCLLLNGISGVRLGTLAVGADLHLRLLDGESRILLGDFLLRLDLDGVRLLLCLARRDGDVALGIRFRNLRVLADLLHVVDTHVLNGTGAVLEVLDIEVYDFNTEFFHIRHDVFRNFLGNALTILHHFLEPDGADDLTHVALQHLRDQRDELALPHVEERLGGALEQFRVGGNLDVRDTVNRDVDELVRRDGFTRLDIHLHDAQRQLVEPLEEGDAETGAPDEDPTAGQPRDDIRRVRRRLDIPGGEEDDE